MSNKIPSLKIIKRKFYQRDTLHIAQDLLGCFLIRKIGRKIIKGVITETEAYVGENDLACHASRGRTPRTEIMYSETGHAYIYLIYGMYYCLNIVTERKNFPAAVLIRSVKVEGADCKKTNGPGKVCRYFKIDKKLNSWDMTKGEKLWIEKKKPAFAKTMAGEVKKSKRIGVDYAKHCRHYLWRFHINSG